ncbi:DNA-3-methyladenine glycosylase 2 family protein [Clostridium botulinum D/C]|uniref:DNA-3-methyladenine glycosylase family protein n=1 Tax=Clostridium botulinum TaxID=1491 RepID=UPI001E5F5CCE|nr:DNA-3-methyladenine glycosylase [Clostridium botulinum]MCD3351183.1 DNA-3-methyladenine glycosylase 2 family protein [Clostridium botulinum D/C]MCD3360138.1 DNA-3-methyladenine glycosylase 2 family protein [Clostridium botulinum D/C]MCD3363017.1 DNA-3-methyladenine glycosylase 2 family protein [Clostridium botulinum D/C]MCD3365945.1 DNA-3-methyladenine glycosylase 2 family protein [Clostridium botulinum D/C]
MEFNYVDKIENGIIIKDVINFELPHIFECGQCFRWNRQENGNYIGVAFGKVVEIEKKGNDVIIYNATEEDFEKIWCDYFDLDRDYSTIKEILSKDELLKKSVEFGLGIRILKQEPFEIVLSFIISANNRIPMIKRAIEKISKRWGKKVQYKDKDYYTFPSVEMLKECTIEELSECGMGFRAKYIKNTIEDIIYNGLNLEYIKSLSDDDCHKELQKLSGVGPKVADCIMLFSMQKYSAFPVDVWVKRAMQYFYLAPDVSLKKIRDFGRNQFNPFCGFAQQYLFYYARENNIRV